MNPSSLREIFEKIPVSLVAFAVLGWLGWDYYTFKNEEASPLFAAKAEIEAIRTDVDKQRQRVLALKKFMRELDQKKVELRQIASGLDQMKVTLSDSFDVPSFMQMTVTEAKKIGLVVTELRPTDKSNKDNYAEQSFEFAFKGAYLQVMLFLNRLAQIQTIVRVDGFSFKSAGFQPKERFARIEGKVNIKGYHYIPTQADSLASGSGAKAPASTGKEEAQ